MAEKDALQTEHDENEQTESNEQPESNDQQETNEQHGGNQQPEGNEQHSGSDPQGSNIDEAADTVAEDESAPDSDERAAQDEQRDTKIEQLEAELAEARRTAEENYQKWLRAQADFDNFRKRTRAEKEEMAKYASLSVIEKLLPCMDNFDRALAASRDNRDFDSLLKGLEMIYGQLNQLLEQEEVKPIEAVGTPFNPEFHQAVMQVESDEHEEGIVVEELQKGYMLKDKVIRPSMVKVSN